MVVETGPFVSSHHRPWISTMTVGVRGTLTKFKRRFRAAEYTPDRALEIPMFLPDDRAILCR